MNKWYLVIDTATQFSQYISAPSAMAAAAIARGDASPEGPNPSGSTLGAEIVALKLS